MCGIVGGFSVNPLAVLDRPGQVDLAIDLLAHRGPDDRGLYVSPDRRAFLGHRRLSIIDLSGGHQPIEDPAGRVRLIYNGEIYNYRELRTALAQRGHVLRTQTDGEVVLPLYRESPAEFERALAGMFAIGLLDEGPPPRLTLVRDRNGIKPLYYYADDTTILFASEIKAILALLPERPALSPPALRLYLRWKYIPDPCTIYRNIFTLSPGHRLTAMPGSGAARLVLEHEQYWQPVYGGDKIEDEEEAIEQLDRALRAAVQSHLVSDVEVGALLSGGVDSSLVVGLAAELSGKRIKTFSVGFEEAGFDQLPYARSLARKYNTEHYEEHVRLDPLETVQRMVRHFDQPFADSSALACFRVCEVAARHVKVALTGDGGDESFAGYKRYEEIVRGGRTGAWRRPVSRALHVASAAVFSPEGKFVRRFESESWNPLERHEARQVLFSDWMARRLLAEPYRSHECPDIFGQHRRMADRAWSDVEIAQYIDLRMYLPGDILTKVDRTSMAWSLECRVPLLDHSVTEFSTRVSTDLKIHDGVRKYLLKRVAERYVPRELLYRPKMGFRIPIRRWFKRELLDRTGELLANGALVRHGVIDRRGLAWMMGAQRRAWMDMASPLWALLFLECWAREYLQAGQA